MQNKRQNNAHPINFFQVPNGVFSGVPDLEN